MLLLLCATLAGCAHSDAKWALTERVKAEGYRTVSVKHRNGDHELLRIRLSDGPGDRARIAEIAWDTYPEHFDALEVTHNRKSEAFSKDDLRARFGERQVTERPDDDNLWPLLLGLLPVAGVLVFLVPLLWMSIRKEIRQMRGHPPVSQADESPQP